jgi:hypothetical protein
MARAAPTLRLEVGKRAFNFRKCVSRRYQDARATSDEQTMVAPKSIVARPSDELQPDVGHMAVLSRAKIGK